MAYSDKQRKLIQSYYEAGLSHSKIIERVEARARKEGWTENVIRAKSQITKMAKANLWIKGKNETLIAREVELNQEIEEIKKQKETKNETDIDVIREIVDEKTKHIAFFNKSALLNQKVANDKISKPEDLTLLDIDAHSRITGRNKQTVVGKAVEEKAKKETASFVIKTSAQRD